MNLSQFDTVEEANTGAVLELRDKHGALALAADGSAMSITLLGEDSDEWRKADNASTNRRLAQGARLKITAEALEADLIGKLAKVTTGWNGFTGDDGAPLPCTYENALKVYRFPLIREQAVTFVTERGNFTKA